MELREPTPVMIICSLCGHAFDPAQHPSCSACPLHSGCSLACCPNCGTTNINPASSKLAGWIKKLIGR